VDGVRPRDDDDGDGRKEDSEAKDDEHECSHKDEE